MPRSAKLVAKQEAIGLQAVTDGEFRRSWWHYDFLSHLDGVELVSVAQGLQFKGTADQGRGPACPRQDRLLAARIR